MLIQRINLKTSVIYLEGELNRAAEYPLMQAYQQATGVGTMNIILDLRGLNYMNSAGIALLISLIQLAHKNGQNLSGFGLSPHLRHILEITQLDRLLPLYSSEQEAIAATRLKPRKPQANAPLETDKVGAA